MAINMENVVNKPVTNEELAGLIIGGNGTNSQMMASFISKFDNFLTSLAKEQGAASAELINSQNKSLKKIEDTLTEQSRTIEKLEGIINNMTYPGNNYRKLDGCYEVLCMPDEIRRDCIALAPTKSPKVTFREILKKMQEISCMDIDAYILKNSHAIRYANFAKSYFVSKDELLFSVYKQAVKVMMDPVSEV